MSHKRPFDFTCRFRLYKTDWDQFREICDRNGANIGAILRSFITKSIADEQEHEEVYGPAIRDAMAATAQVGMANAEIQNK